LVGAEVAVVGLPVMLQVAVVVPERSLKVKLLA
jgi:hypothetical protein